MNGAIFLISAYDAFEGHSPIWIVAVDAALGFAQLAVLFRSRKGGLPQRIPYALAAFGMFASGIAVSSHRSGLPYAHLFAGFVNLTFAVFGPDAVRRIVRRSKA